MRLQAAATSPNRRTLKRKPSAFAPAVGVKNSAGTPAPSGTSNPTRSPPTSTSNSTLSHNAKPRLSLSVRSSIVHFLSGGLAAGLVRASLQPLDTCKTRLQVSRQIDRSVTSLVQLLFTNGGGLPGLYRGVVPGVAGIVPAAAVYMVTFQALKSHLSERFPRRRNDVVVAFAAGVGDVAASLVRVPCEVLKQRLQVGVYDNVFAALRSVAASGRSGGGGGGINGFARLYSGLSAQLTRDVPYAAAEFVMYENLKSLVLRRADRRRENAQEKALDATSGGRTGRGGHGEHLAAARLQQRLQDRKLGRLDSLLVGAVAGAFAAVISNPADVVKTRLMTQVRRPASHIGSALATASPVPYRGVRDTLVRIAKEEGLAAFGKGITPRIAAKALQSALFFAAYEGLRRAIGRAMNVEVVAKPVH